MTFPDFNEFLAKYDSSNDSGNNSEVTNPYEEVGSKSAQMIFETMLGLLKSYHQWLSQNLENKE